MSEGDLWRLMRSRLAPFGRLTRIENRCDKGTPDVAYTLCYGKVGEAPTRSGWIENKFLPRWPARESTPVRIDKLTLDQVTWLEDEARANGRAWCMLQVEDDYFLLDPRAVRRLYSGELTKAALFEVATVAGVGFPFRRVLAELTR